MKDPVFSYIRRFFAHKHRDRRLHKDEFTGPVLEFAAANNVMPDSLRICGSCKRVRTARKRKATPSMVETAKLPDHRMHTFSENKP